MVQARETLEARLSRGWQLGLAVVSVVGLRLVAAVDLLLDVLVDVVHAQTHVVPELWMASQLVTSLLKVSEGLKVLLVLVESKAKVVQDLSRPLTVEIADVLMWALRLLRVGLI